MIRWLFICVFSLVIVPVTGIQAQNLFSQDRIWYYAWDDELSVLYAFNLDGEIHNLGAIFQPQGVWRIDSQRQLMHVSNNDNGFSLVLATPDSLQVLRDELEEIHLPIAYHDPYLVLRPIQLRNEATPMLLVNLDSGTVETLMAASMVDTVTCCRFSDDGGQLRTLTRIDSADDPKIADFELRERDLMTGAETLHATYQMIADRFYMFSSTPDGGQWVVREVDSTTDRILTFSLVDLNGNMEQLSQGAVGDVEYRLFEDDLVEWFPRCEADCIMNLTDLPTGEKKTYDIGDGLGGFPRPIYVGEDGLIANIGAGQMMRLSNDESPEVLGYYLPQKMGPDFISPDGRWSILFDQEENPGALLIRDHDSERGIVGRVNTPEAIYIITRFSGDHIIIWDSRPDGAYYTINMSTGNQVQWPMIRRVVIQVILSDEEALVATPGYEDLELEAGVYLLNRETEDLSLVMPGRLFIVEGVLLADSVQRTGRG